MIPTSRDKSFLLTLRIYIVPEAGFEPAHPKSDATPSRWCVYQFHHSGSRYIIAKYKADVK